MSEKFNGAVTAVGASLITKAIADNTKMTFLKIVGSKSTYTDKQLPTLTDDVLSSASHDQEGHISNVTIADETTIKTELVLNGNSVEADYQLNTVLILATVDGTDHLFGVLKANQPQYMNAYDGISSTNLEINCSFKVANADAVSIIVDSAGTLTVDDYNRLHDYTDSQVASASGVANKRMDSAVAVEAENRATAVTSEATVRSSAVAAEATARSNAISSEAAARAAADTKLQNSASIAASDIAVLRTSAASYTDTKVKSAATVASNATSDEAVNRASAVAAEATTRSNAVSDEAAKRIKADSAESAARSTADSSEAATRSSAIVAETKARTAADSSEANARSAADKTLTDSITKVSDKLDDTKTELVKNIDNQVGAVNQKVDDIQVGGTNLAPGTSSDWQKASVQSDWGVTYLCDPTYEIVDGETYTAQVEVRNITRPIALETFCFTASGNRDGTLAPDKRTDNDGKIIITFTAHLPDGYAYFMPNLAFAHLLTSAGSYEFRRFKIERGNKATDWTPAPEDIDAEIANEAKARSDADVAINTKVTANSAAAAKAQSTADSKFAGMAWLPKNTNADTVTDPGMYYNSGDADVATMTNFPTTHAFSMQVVKSAGIIQFLTEYMTDASSHIWFRAQYDSKFGAWRQIALVGQDTTVTGYYAFTNDKGLVIRNVVPKLDMDAGNGDKAVIIGYKGGDANGDGIAIGAGGTTVVGGGEAANTYLDALRDGTLPSQFVKPSGIGDEHAILASDGVVHLISSMQNPAGAHEAILDASGNFFLPANLSAAGELTVSGGASIGGVVNINGSVLATVNGFQKLIQASSMTDGGYVAVGNDGSDKGYVELGTTDDGDTAVFVRKRNGSNSILSEAVLLDRTNNTNFPGTLNQAGKPVATQDFVKAGDDAINKRIKALEDEVTANAQAGKVHFGYMSEIIDQLQNGWTVSDPEHTSYRMICTNPAKREATLYINCGGPLGDNKTPTIPAYGSTTMFTLKKTVIEELYGPINAFANYNGWGVHMMSEIHPDTNALGVHSSVNAVTDGGGWAIGLICQCRYAWGLVFE